MPRKPRADGEGLWHHAMNRGIDRASIFDEEATRLFLIELRDSCDQWQVQVHGYCILPNHYHLLLHTPRAGLSRVMQRLSSRFTQEVNRHRGRDGPLFKGRFRSIFIDNEAHLVRASRYIHLNPVEAGLVTAPQDWPWSSAGAYLGLAPRPKWLHVGELLGMFGTANPVAAYADYLAGDDDKGSDPSRKRL